MTKLMAHLVANYPTPEISFEVASSLVEGGADIIEVQLPFSDPSADGPSIQNACSKVLENGSTTKDGLAFIKKIHDTFPNVKIALMSYASLVVTPGVENFCKKAGEAGVNFMIIPDLPFDCDEGLTEYSAKYGMENVPVAAPSMSDERFQKMLDCGFKSVYAVLRSGITGTQTTIDENTFSFIKRFDKKNKSGITPGIFGGFGLSTGAQSKAISPYVEGIVAGSVFVRIIDENKNDTAKLKKAITEKVKELKDF